MAVDAATGTVCVLDAVLAVDAGRIIKPGGLRGQLAGGFVYGLGMALTEDLALEDGPVRAANLGDYKLPTIADVPPLRTTHLSDEHGVGAYGARSAGELVNPGVPAAILRGLWGRVNLQHLGVDQKLHRHGLVYTTEDRLVALCADCSKKQDRALGCARANAGIGNGPAGKRERICHLALHPVLEQTLRNRAFEYLWPLPSECRWSNDYPI